MTLLRTALVCLLLLPLLLWGGFRIWLVNQEPAFRASIESFGALELIVVIRDTVFPPDIPDRASFGRRHEQGRGHAPWVLRTSLDGRPRILAIALAPELWLAYSTETASIHQLWQGTIDFTGPVHDAQHGVEPMSRGTAYARPPEATAWRVRPAGRLQPTEHEADAGERRAWPWSAARIRWLGHGFEPESGRLWLRYEVGGGDGPGRIVTEWPEHVTASDGSGRVGLERRFTTTGRAGISLALVPMKPQGNSQDSANTDRGSLVMPDEFEDGSAGTEFRFVEWFNRPTLVLEPPNIELREDAFSGLDCQTCHHERERIVGPAWSEIALRYAGAERDVTAGQLARRIVEGSNGRWGPTAMPPHPELTQESAVELAHHILQTEPAKAPTATPSSSGDGDPAVWTYGFITEPRPESVHPSLTATPLHDGDFTPRVGGLAWLPDGRLGVATWDPDGSVYAVADWDDPGGAVRAERIAEGLQEPLGLAVVGDAVYVMQKQELTRLIDHDGDGRTDEYRNLNNTWTTTSNFHEFGFGLVHLGDALYGALSVCVLNGGKSCREQVADRGKIFKVALDTGELEFVASGFRTPNGLAATPDGGLLVTDNQGDWLPASKLVRIPVGESLGSETSGERSGFYGWRAPGDELVDRSAIAPALWLPQNEVGNSPTQPLAVTQGPYAGHLLFGDVFNGGLKRAVLEEVSGQLQGAAFHFSGGLQGPVNRLLAAPDGSMIAGQVGSLGNWGEFGKQGYGLERLRFSKMPAFEPMRVAATPGGFDIEFSRPIASDSELRADAFQLSHWYYVPSEIYGGPKYDLATLSVSELSLTPDRRVVSLEVEGLEAGRVVYFHIDRALRAEDGSELWVNEAWYTLNAIPPPTLPASPSVGAAPPVAPAEPVDALPNMLSDSEQADGWELLFDGESFAGWKIYGAAPGETEGWTIEDGSLRFTRDVSFAGLVWNHLNPFTPAALDLMTTERFDAFELALEWKIAPGGNSGIFYLVPDESSRLSWDLGLEMQVLDDTGHADGQLDRRRAGDLYDIATGPPHPAPAPDEWHRARIRVDKIDGVEGQRIRHWLDDELRVDIRRGSPEWQRAIADSKFAGIDGFGLAPSGHITLQDHGDVVWYRNIKLLRLGGGE